MLKINYLLSEYLRKQDVILHLKGKKKEEIIKEMVDRIDDVGEDDKEKIFQKIMRREELESTGIGNGIAIPHARSEEVGKLRVLFALSKEGVDFDALDGKPVHLIFLILSPEREKNLYIKILARLSRLLKQPGFKKDLMNAKNEDEVIEIIKSYDVI